MASNVDYTGTGLVAAIQRKALLPNTAETLASTDFFALMNEELLTNIVPLIMSSREEYYVTTLIPDVTFAGNQDTVPIPYRSIGGQIRTIQIQMSASSTLSFVPLPRVEPERDFNYQVAGGTVSAYDLEGNNIVLVPRPTFAGLLRIRYPLRPGQVVDASACAQITSINTGTNTVTCGGGLPGTFTSGIAYDLIKGTPNFDTYAFDQIGTVAGNNITFSALPSGSLGQGGTLAVGDWVALAGQTPIPQLPYDLFPLLSQATVCAALESLGDQKGLAAAQAKFDKLSKSLLGLMQPRTPGSARVIINYYGPGFARIGRFRRR